MKSLTGELVVLSGPFKGRRVPLAKSVIRLGRDKTCDVSLEDEAASRVHAVITKNEDEVLVRDMDSTNGTFVNDTRIDQAPLKNGDRLGVGDTVFLVEIFRGPGSAEPDLVFMEEREAVSTRLTLNLDDTRFLQLKEGTSIPDAQRHFTLMYQFMVEISGVLHRPALMERVLDFLIESFSADRGVILLLTAEGEPGDKIVRIREGSDSATNIAISRTMAQQLLEKKESFLSVDAESDQRLAHAESIHDMRVRSIMGVPLKLKDRVLGMVYLDKIVAGEAFSEMDLKLCTAMALQAAVCLENSSLYAELLDSAEYNTSILSSLASGLVVVDLRDQIIRVNSAAREIIQKEERELLNKSLSSIPELSELSQVIQATLRTGKAEDRYEVRIRVGDQTVPLGLNTSVLTDHSGKTVGVVANFRDLRHIHRLQDQLRNSQHLAALGQMAAGVAHEIRNPLNSIRGFTQLIQEAATKEGLNSPKFSEYPKIVLEEVDRMNHIVQDLLDYSRQRELTLTPVIIEDVLTTLQKEQEPEFNEAKVALKLDLPPDPLPGVLGNHEKLVQVLTNLVLNALQASQPGGEVMISARATTGTILEKAEDGATKEIPRQELAIKVTDKGSGIAAEHIQKVFDPFFTQKEVGTGLGLSISQRIANQHGGRIEVSSELNKGSVFTIFLPAV